MMSNKKSAIFYTFLCVAAFCLFCMWYFTSAEKTAAYIAEEKGPGPAADSAPPEDDINRPADESKTLSADAVNLNTATAADLTALPEIGETTAKLIIDYRNKNNGFASAREIMNVKGIGEKTYKKLEAFIYVE